MAETDSRGLEISTGSIAAAASYRAGVDLMLSLWLGTEEAFRQAISADPEFALAHAALARHYAICSDLSQAKSAIALAMDLAQRRGTERERSHVNALALAIHGKGKEALSAVLQHVDRWPLDVMIFGLPLGAFGLFAFSGMADHNHARVSLCERYSHRFPIDDWWFLTYRGWSHTENGNLPYGRSLTEQALDRRWENANAAHALAHLLHEAGEGHESKSFIQRWLPGYDPKAVLHGHIAWHGALAFLEQDDAFTAMQIFANQVAPSVSFGTPLNVISDTASFLWRVEAYGYQVPFELWQEVAQFASSHFQAPGFAFADVHMAMIEATACDAGALKKRIEGIKQLADSANIAPSVSLALCKAIQQYAEGNYKACADTLQSTLDDVVRIGGSGAQREIFEDTFLISCFRVGDFDRVKPILSNRLQRRPSIRDATWLNGLS